MFPENPQNGMDDRGEMLRRRPAETLPNMHPRYYADKLFQSATLRAGRTSYNTRKHIHTHTLGINGKWFVWVLGIGFVFGTAQHEANLARALRCNSV